jgi:hypothetical protein
MICKEDEDRGSIGRKEMEGPESDDNTHDSGGEEIEGGRS